MKRIILEEHQVIDWTLKFALVMAIVMEVCIVATFIATFISTISILTLVDAVFTFMTAFDIIATILWVLFLLIFVEVVDDSY